MSQATERTASGESSSTSTPIIQATNISREYQLGSETVHAVRNVDLEVRLGEFITLVGRSGSGKTTLLNLLAGLDHPTSGQVLFEGEDLAEYSEKQFIQLRRHRIGVVFQSFALLPLLSAYENVELPMRIAGVGASERSKRTNEVLDIVGLSRRAKHRPYELSGGEQQRISIARAVAMRPNVILADEPTGELDTATGDEVVALLRGLWVDQKATVIVVTHDQSYVTADDRVLRMRDGSLETTATPALR